MTDTDDGFMDAGSPDPREDSVAESAGSRRWHDWFDVRFRTPAAVYGLIVYSALLMITADHDTDVTDVVVSSVATLIVFFIAHVFAYTLADHGKHPLGRATRYALTHSSGMLWAALPPTLAMIIAGASGLQAEEASGYALWATMAVLAFLGYVAYSRTGAGIARRILGATGTALRGAFVAILEYAFH